MKRKMKKSHPWGGILGGMLAVCLACGNVSAGLVGGWNFDGNFKDHVGGLNGTFNGTGSPTYTTNGGHTFLSLNGVDQFVNVPAVGNNLDINSGSFSIVAWVTLNPVNDSRRESVVAGKFSAGNIGYALTADYINLTGTNDNTRLFYGYAGPAANGYTADSFQGSSYAMLAIVRDGAAGTISDYRNGAFRNSNASTGSFPSTSDFFLGGFSGAAILKIDLDEVLVYNSTLSASEITALYNGGNGPSPTLIPEPSAVGLALLGLGALGWRKLRAKKV